MTKLFVTGVTGYLGGDAVHRIIKEHPEYDVTCLVRDSEKGAMFKKTHSNVRIVLGDLVDSALLEEEAAKADIVCNFANGTHEGAAHALVQGLLRRDDEGPSFLIHTLGAGIMIYDDVMANRYGQDTDKVFNDLEGVVEAISVPDIANARGAEQAVRQAGIDHPGQIKTAIVCTGSAYGTGRGNVTYRPTAIHELARCILQKGHGIQVGKGLAAWRNVYVQDLSNLYLALVEHAAAGGYEEEGKPAVWGGWDGFYFAENGQHVWGELAQRISEEARAQGLSVSSPVVSIEPTEAMKLTAMGQFFWGCNARIEARRARKALNWTPCGPSLWEEIKAIVATEGGKMNRAAA